MKAIILAGGMGTRLHPLTIDLPKPMVPLANRPIMSYIVELLAQHGFTEIDVLLYYQPEVIKNFFKTGRQFGVKLNYLEATEDFGTAGAVKFASQGRREPVLVISADLVTDLNLAAAVAFHQQKKALATLVLARVPDPIAYGIVVTDKNGRIKRFLEKPSYSEIFSDAVNAGIYLLEPEALDYIPLEKYFDFSLNLFPLLLEKQKPIYGFAADGYWKDIGQLEDYGRVHHDVLAGKVKMRIAEVAAGNILLGEGSVVDKGALLANCVIGQKCRIAAGASLKECVLWDGVEIGAGAKLERTIVGHQVKIGSGANLGEGVVIGNESEIGRDTEIKPFIKVWPRKVIEAGSVVSRSIIWREHWTKSIFGQFGVNGICNVEISPQFAAALGAAYGTVLGKGARLVCSRDSHKGSRMIYRALMSGVLSAGVSISDLDMAPIPVNRYAVSSLKAQGGFHVRKSPFDQEVVDLKFFDAGGLDLSAAVEKKIERKFFSEDFARITMDEAGEISYPFHRAAEEYQAGLLGCLEACVICAANFKLVVDYSYGATSQIFPAILGKLGLEAVALDAYIDENKITKDKAAFDRSLQQMTRIVKSVKADVGIMLDTGAEKIFFCDERGRVIDGNRALGIMSVLALRSNKQAQIAVPLKESRIMEQLAAKYHGQVIRTKNSFRGMMEVAERGEAVFLGESQGGYIFPDFMPSFDGMLSIGKLVEYLCREKTKLSDLAAEIPTVNLLKMEIPCASEHKGLLMRRAVEKVKGVDKVEARDGLKFWQGDDWALILPDAVRPVVHLFAEAGSPGKTRQLLEKYSKLLNKLKED